MTIVIFRDFLGLENGLPMAFHDFPEPVGILLIIISLYVGIRQWLRRRGPVLVGRCIGQLTEGEKRK